VMGVYPDIVVQLLGHCRQHRSHTHYAFEVSVQPLSRKQISLARHDMAFVPNVYMLILLPFDSVSSISPPCHKTMS
jgi:hypothetical protein